MRFVTGTYHPKSGQFVPYTINDFISELAKLQNYAYSDFENDLASLCEASGVTLDDFMRYTLPSEDGRTLRNYLLFDLPSSTVRNNGWSTMDNNFFSGTFPVLNNIRRVLGYKVTGNLTGPIVKDQYSARPITRHINSYTNRMPIFEFFINSKDSYKYDKSIPENRIVIQFGYYIGREGARQNIFKMQNVDTYFRVTKKTPVSNPDGSTSWQYEGVLDIEGHLPYTLDHFFALKIRAAVKAAQTGPTNLNPDDLIYVLSPEQRIAMGIIDKLKMIMSYKTSRPKPVDLKNAITKAMLRDIKLLTGDINRKIQTVSRIKVLPLNRTMNDDRINYTYYNKGLESDSASQYYQGSYFFNWFDENYKAKSWSDAFSSKINFSVDQLRDTIEAFKLNITFLSEKAMTDGIFCVDTDEFKAFLRQDSVYGPIVDNCISHDIDVNTNIVSHVFMRHGEGLAKDFQEVISIAKVTPEMERSPLKYMTACKKWNQRKKLVVAEKFPVNYKNDSLVVTGEPGYELAFKRDIVALAPDIDSYFKKDRFHVNVLVGFIEGDFNKIDISLDEYTKMGPEELDRFHKKLDGVSCDGWFTDAFLYGTELVAPRTIVINSKDYELSDNMLGYLAHLDKIANATESDPIVINIERGQYKIKELVSHYTVKCDHCESRMVEGDEFTSKARLLPNGLFSYVKPESKSFFCPLCEYHTINPAAGFVLNKGDSSYHDDAIVRKHYIGDGHGKFNKLIIKGYKRHEDGLDLRVEVYYDLANARATGPDILKFVFQPRSNEFIGKVKELKVRDPETGEVRVFKNLQLDGLLTGGSNKAAEVAIMNSQLRLNALVWGRKRVKEQPFYAAPHEQFDVDGELMDLPFDVENVYYPNKYISNDNPDFSLQEINEKIIQHVERCDVIREVWDSDQNCFVEKTFKMYVGITSLNATEVSQEFNTVYTLDNPRKISLNNSDHLHQLGYSTYVHKLYQQNRMSYAEGFAKDSRIADIDLELLRILGTLMLPLKNVDEYDENEEQISKYIQDLNEKRNPDNKIGQLVISDFSQGRENRVAITNWLPYSEYKKIERSHPLFNSEKFINGNYSYFTFSDWVTVKTASSVRSNRRIEHRYCLRFPTAKLMHSLLDISADGLKVRLNEIYTAFLNLFETISTSSYAALEANKLSSPLKLEQNYITVSAIVQLKKAILNYFLTKEGSFTQNLAINLPGIGSKQTASTFVPDDVVVVGDDQDYRRVVSDVLIGLYPDQSQDWRVSYSNEGYDNLGWCWTAELHALAHRDPVIWPDQNYACRVWSRHKANVEFKKMYGKTFDEIHPGCKSIVSNSVRMVKDQESDVDGDWLCVVFNYDQEAVPYIKEYLEEAASNGFSKDPSYYDAKIAYLESQQVVNIEKLNRFKIHKLYSNMTRNVKFSYLMDEAKSLYKTYPDKLVYDLTDSKVSLRMETVALLEATESKKDIGFLTNSMRYTTYVIDLLKKLVEDNPTRFKFSISNEDQTAITFIFQYLLLQRNGVRAVKADGSFGKLTFNAIVTDSRIRVITDNEPKFEPARLLFKQLLTEFDEEYGTDLKKYYNVIISICDDFMISDRTDWGGGYIRKRLDAPDDYGRYEVIELDRTGTHITPTFRDFMGLFHLIIGSSYATFARIHGEDALFRGIYNNTLSRIPMLKHVGNDLQNLVKER